MANNDTPQGLVQIVFVSLPHYVADYIEMEELAHLQASRKGYRSHVIRIFNKTDDTIDKDIDEFSLTYLRTAVEQLQKKKELINQINQWIAELIQTPKELKEAVCEAKELQDSILEKVSQLMTHIELKTQELTSKSLLNNVENVVTTSLASEPENAHTSLQCSSIILWVLVPCLLPPS